jgi:3D (Asp-Asp-Asp) domain-containing protein
VAASVVAVALGVTGLNLARAYAAPAGGLAACKHFSNVVPPNRPAGPSHNSRTQGPKISLSGRLPAPAVTGSYDGSKVTLTLTRVAGAKAYRVWRNGQSVAWVDDWGQAAIVATDRTPCRRAFYTVVALRQGDASDASTGQLSPAYRLEDSGALKAFRFAVGTRFTYKVTSYNDAGQTASGYRAGLGKCAVDARFIPWGTRFRVDGYGWCYAADIGTWIQGNIVDVWLPGSEADQWGVQSRTITVG